jgi:hypothetical protein
MPKNNVFISYARTDEAFARQIASLLSKEGLNVWIDVQDIPAGERWSNAIQQGLDAAEVMLLVITPESMTSKNVADEWMYFRDKDKPIIPLILRPAEMHYRLSSLQWVDFSEPGGHFLTTYAALRAELERVGSDLSSAIGQAPFTIKGPPIARASHEEERRLDAAMPRQVSLNQPTEVWVQLCLPGSEGFRDQLPHYTEQGDVINQADVREQAMNVHYPLDPATQQPVPVYVMVEVRGADFEIADPDQQVMLTPGKDSPLLVFGVTPTSVRSRSALQVMVTITTPDGQMVTVGSGALATEVLPVGVERAAQVVWGFISRQLGKVSEAGKAAAPQALPHDPPKPSVPPPAPAVPAGYAPLPPPPAPAPITPALPVASLEETLDDVVTEPEFVKQPEPAASFGEPTRASRDDRTLPMPHASPAPPKVGAPRHWLIVAAVVGLLLLVLLVMSVTNTQAPGSMTNTQAPARGAEQLTATPLAIPSPVDGSDDDDG